MQAEQLRSRLGIVPLDVEGLEDMIVITDTKAEIISDFVPWDVAGIEKLMAEDGMLQRYPRDEANHH